MEADAKKVRALIALLDDPNDDVFHSVEEELLKEPVEIVSDLEKAWESSLDGLFQERVESIIHNLQFNDVLHELKKWLIDDQRDLLYGAYLVCKYQYPELKYVLIKEQIASLKRDIWLELNAHLTSLEKIRVVNHVLFDVHNFTRNNSRFLAPENNFINDVLKTQKGNPISLSVIYSVLCNELGIPVFGVNLPKNFVLAHMDESSVPEGSRLEDGASVLFYINPINKGAVLGRKEIEYFVKQQKLEPHENYFLPCDSRLIIRRMFNNLMYAHENGGNDEKRKQIGKLLSLFNNYI